MKFSENVNYKMAKSLDMENKTFVFQNIILYEHII